MNLHTCMSKTFTFYVQILSNSTSPQPSILCNGSDAAAHCLRLPGKSLYLTPLLKAKRFRNFGYKTGALKAFQELQLAQLGSLEEIGAGKGTQTVSLCMLKRTIIYIYTCTCMYAYYTYTCFNER